jgi:hypothetical protein
MQRRSQRASANVSSESTAQEEGPLQHINKLASASFTSSERAGKCNTGSRLGPPGMKSQRPQIQSPITTRRPMTPEYGEEGPGEWRSDKGPTRGVRTWGPVYNRDGVPHRGLSGGRETWAQLGCGGNQRQEWLTANSESRALELAGRSVVYRQ